MLRVSQLNEWCKEFILPPNIWISGLIFPKGLLAALKQVHIEFCHGDGDGDGHGHGHGHGHGDGEDDDSSGKK